MGVGWRRFTERMHQGLPLTSAGSLQPTSNARCSTMLREATTFTVQLKRCEKAIRSMHAANSDTATTIALVMSSPLPRQWEETAAASGGAASPGVKPIGSANFNAEAMASAFQEAGHKTETEVLAPLTRWHEVYMQLETRFRDLERVRLELDSRRRTVADLTQKVEVMRARLSQGGDAKREAALQDCTKLLQHKEGKLHATSQTFLETERLLQRDLSTLIRDSAYLRLYAAAAMRLQGNALLTGAEAFGPMPAASPTPASKLAITDGMPATTPAMHTPAISANKPSTGVLTPDPGAHDMHDMPPSVTISTSSASHTPAAASGVGSMGSYVGSEGPGAAPVIAEHYSLPSNASAGSLPPVTPSGGGQPSPMARFPVTDGQRHVEASPYAV